MPAIFDYNSIEYHTFEFIIDLVQSICAKCIHLIHLRLAMLAPTYMAYTLDSQAEHQ